MAMDHYPDELQADEPRPTEVSLAGLTPNAMDALLRTIAKVPSLIKTNENEVGKYLYASIDDFYEHVARLAADEGLTIQTVERNAVPLGTQAILYTFACRLLYLDRSQNAVEVYDNLSRISIPHPFQGPQTAGSVMSYAEKVFMRMVYKVRTGEPDADTVPNGRVQRGNPVPAQPPLPNVVLPVRGYGEEGMVDWTYVATRLINKATFTKKREDLRRLWERHELLTEQMREVAPELHERLRASFNQKQQSMLS